MRQSRYTHTMDGSLALDIESYERRREPRVMASFEVDALLVSGERWGEQLLGQVVDLSRRGAGIVFKKLISVKTQISLTIFSNNGNESQCAGEIVWAREIKGRMVHGIRIAGWSRLEESIQQILP